MSLILEALRRSEAERRRGQAPGLLDRQAPPPQATRPAWPAAAAGLLGGLLLAAGLAWWLRPAAQTPVTAGAPAMTPPRAAAVDVPTAAPAGAATPAAAIPDSEAPRAPAPVPRATATRTQATAAAAQRDVHTAPAPDARPTPLPTAPAPSAEVADAAAMRGAAPGDVPLAELDGALRATLPALRVSMHVFADDPDRRFAIVDGRRVREGDVLEGGLQVLAIRPEGLRLAWQGRVLWLPA